MNEEKVRAMNEERVRSLTGDGGGRREGGKANADIALPRYGYSVVNQINTDHPRMTDEQPSWLFAET